MTHAALSTSYCQDIRNSKSLLPVSCPCRADA
jgi:hypothetical protein